MGDSLAARIPITGERPPLHDRGQVLVQAMLMLAGGREACSDIEHPPTPTRCVRVGAVGLDAAPYLRGIDLSTLSGLWEAMVEVRAHSRTPSPRCARARPRHVEDNIRRLKNSGADRFPFVDIDADRTWLAVACFADALVRPDTDPGARQVLSVPRRRPSRRRNAPPPDRRLNQSRQPPSAPIS